MRTRTATAVRRDYVVSRTLNLLSDNSETHDVHLLSTHSNQRATFHCVSLRDALALQEKLADLINAHTVEIAEISWG